MRCGDDFTRCLHRRHGSAAGRRSRLKCLVAERHIKARAGRGDFHIRGDHRLAAADRGSHRPSGARRRRCTPSHRRHLRPQETAGPPSSLRARAEAFFPNSTKRPPKGSAVCRRLAGPARIAEFATAEIASEERPEILDEARPCEGNGATCRNNRGDCRLRCRSPTHGRPNMCRRPRLLPCRTCPSRCH
jgi:hypothetical protein